MITPKKFQNSFQQATKHYAAEIVDAWDNSTDLTQLMQRKVFRHIAESVQLTIHFEVPFKIDAVLSDDKRSQISVAIEIESLSTTAINELQKLSYLNAPLKVLITYIGNDEQTHSNYLCQYSELIEASDIFSDFSTARKQLIIFGNLDENNKPEWHTYLYNSAGGFTKI